MGGIITIVIIVALLVAIFTASVKLIPQGEAAVIERLGRYTRTASGGLTFLVPYIDRVRQRVDTRERVVSFPPQAVITQDNLTVAIDTVVTFQINDPAKAIYGVDNYLVGVEQISVATLRDVVGGMTLEETLTSRETINRRLRGELDAAVDPDEEFVIVGEHRHVLPDLLQRRRGHLHAPAGLGQRAVAADDEDRCGRHASHGAQQR